MYPILDEKELAANWDDVKKEELKAIQRRREQAGLAPDPTQSGASTTPQQLVGVALSGGGIRSACFNLGFLQALVQRKVMRYVDYLSTVSGGGYIGSFFSSLAHRRWRERAERAKAPKNAGAEPPEPADPLPLTPDPDSHKQPDIVQGLVSSSRYLNDMPGFFNRYLVGTLLLNLTFISAALTVCTLLAYLWRAMDQQSVVHYFIWFSNSILVEAVRPFFPAFLVLVVLWLPSWVWSFLRHGSGAPARLSGIFLVLLAISLLVGFAIWLGTPNMNFANVLSPNFVNKEHQLSRWPSELIYPLTGLLLVCLIPFVRPAELLKSGQQSHTPWKRWVFNAAGLALLLGVPFLLVYYIGRHNISGVADRWDRDLVASDVLDWEDMLLRVTNEGQNAQNKKKRPGSELREFIQKEAKGELNKEIQNTVKMVKFNRRDHASFLDYMTAEVLKENIAAKMNEAISQYKFSYDILKDQHKKPGDEPANAEKSPALLHADKTKMWEDDIVAALANFEKLIEKQRDGEKKERLQAELVKIREMLDSFSGRMSNTPMLDTLAKDLPDFINDERARLKLNEADVEHVRARLQEREKAAAKKRESLESERAANQTNKAAREKKLEELRKNLGAAEADQFELDARGEQSKKKAEELRDVIASLKAKIEVLERLILALMEALKGLDKALNNLQRQARAEREAVYTENANLRDEWYKVFFPTGIQPKAAGHLLLRLFYPEDFREIRFVSRPLVIEADQEFRGWLLIGSFLFFVACGSLIDFNYSSLHGYYQSRLQRAFLVRYSPVAEGDQHRDLPLAALKNVEEGQPYHILCGTAETIHGRRLEHRLTAFQFAQQYCGSTELGFAKTEAYCNGRVSLADAMSISGAAVNPMRVENLLVKILLVITNFRLGQWLPHPVRGPSRCFVPFFRIASALMQNQPTNTQRFVFVSDGGFYDNLGIDILLERRCRLIVASDAGADEKIELADLARLYRLCHDKGIRLVNLHDDKLITMESILDAVKKHNLAICRILYPGEGEGLLFHVKSFLVPPATLDLAHYQVTHSQFPHDATTNQFFDEVQFKCYQELGWQIGQKVCDRLFPEEWGEKPIQIERLKELLVENTEEQPPAPKPRGKKGSMQP